MPTRFYAKARMYVLHAPMCNAEIYAVSMNSHVYNQVSDVHKK